MQIGLAMKKMKDILLSGRRIFATIGLAVIAAGCIDEDLSDCGMEFSINYSLRLTTNMHAEIEEELKSLHHKTLGERLKKELNNVFNNHAHDIMLSFFRQDSTLHHYEYDEPNHSSASYTIYLPIEDYIHTAVANEGEETAVTMSGSDDARTHSLIHTTTDTLESHTTGIYTARQEISVAGVSATFDVPLYMQNCATALVIDPKSVPVKSIRAVVSGMANGFHLQDSLYTYRSESVLRMKELTDTDSPLHCLYGVGFPTRNQIVSTRSDDKPYIWRMHVYVTLTGGKTTANTLYMTTPLKAGSLDVVKATLNDEGVTIPDDPKVGVSIELNWKPGGEYDQEI